MLTLSLPVLPAAQRVRFSPRATRLAAPSARRVAVRAGLVQQLTGEELEVAIAERTKPLVIDFYARWAACERVGGGSAHCALTCAADARGPPRPRAAGAGRAS